MLATVYLKSPAEQRTGPIVVLFGTERFLKHEGLRAVTEQVLGGTGDDLSLTRLNGEETDLVTVTDALLTVSMWSPRQLVLIEDADEFVSEYRAGLEQYLERPAKKSVLVLDVKSWPNNTRLAKKVAVIGLPIDCQALKEPFVLPWLADQSRRKHGKTLDRDAATRLVELAGTELGLLDQELAKLAAGVGDAPAIPVEIVEKLVGGWKAETTWKMLDAVRDGHLGLAVEYLDKLLISGEHPLKLLGGINYVYRPIARATEMSRQGTPLAEALSRAGVKPFQVQSVSAYLKRIGFARASRFTNLLMQADLDIKGASSLSERLVMERLLVQLGGESA